MARRHDIDKGMVVRSGDGRELGSILRCGEDGFQIEKGVFFPDEYVASYEDVLEVRRGEVYLRRALDELRPVNPVGAEATGVVSSDQELEQWTDDREFDQGPPSRKSA